MVMFGVFPPYSLLNLLWLSAVQCRLHDRSDWIAAAWGHPGEWVGFSSAIGLGQDPLPCSWLARFLKNPPTWPTHSRLSTLTSSVTLKM